MSLPLGAPTPHGAANPPAPTRTRRSRWTPSASGWHSCTKYTYDPAVRTAVRITQEYPGVSITRTFFKVHGMAGLRIGYAVGQEETVSRIPQAWHLGSMNTLSASGGVLHIFLRTIPVGGTS